MVDGECPYVKSDVVTIGAEAGDWTGLELNCYTMTMGVDFVVSRVVLIVFDVGRGLVATVVDLSNVVPFGVVLAILV